MKKLRALYIQVWPSKSCTELPEQDILRQAGCTRELLAGSSLEWLRKARAGGNLQRLGMPWAGDNFPRLRKPLAGNNLKRLGLPQTGNNLWSSWLGEGDCMGLMNNRNLVEQGNSKMLEEGAQSIDLLAELEDC